MSEAKMSETCVCGHILDEHAGNGEWCVGFDCRCIAFESEGEKDE